MLQTEAPSDDPFAASLGLLWQPPVLCQLARREPEQNAEECLQTDKPIYIREFRAHSDAKHLEFQQPEASDTLLTGVPFEPCKKQKLCERLHTSYARRCLCVVYDMMIYVDVYFCSAMHICTYVYMYVCIYTCVCDCMYPDVHVCVLC